MNKNNAKSLVISVISHGNNLMINNLLQMLAKVDVSFVNRVILTQNIPENDPLTPPSGWPFPLEIRRNVRPLGFSENHNRALQFAKEDYFCIVNPDVEIDDEKIFSNMIEELFLKNSSMIYPIQLSIDGDIQDSEREVPTPWKIFCRYALKNKEVAVEWVNGAFWIIKKETWNHLEGLDEKYFLYCEDVDFCLRLQLNGFDLLKSNSSIVHLAQKSSHRNFKNYIYHVSSLIKLWCSNVFWKWQFKKIFNRNK